MVPLQQATDEFLAAEPPLEAVAAYLAKLERRRLDVLALRGRVPLNLVRLDVQALNAKLGEKLGAVIQHTTEAIVLRTRKFNRGLCEQCVAAVPVVPSPPHVAHV